MTLTRIQSLTKFQHGGKQASRNHHLSQSEDSHSSRDAQSAAPILITFYRGVVSPQCFTALGGSTKRSSQLQKVVVISTIVK